MTRSHGGGWIVVVVAAVAVAPLIWLEESFVAPLLVVAHDCALVWHARSGVSSLAWFVAPFRLVVVGPIL